MRDWFSPMDDAIQAIAAGQVVIVLDDDRENEGDFVMAAEKVSPQMVHLMISKGRGQLCMPIMPGLADRLGFVPMVSDDTDATLPRFTVPVDHRNCKTGISPLERTLTIRTIIETTSQPDDFVQPGHVFPLIAKEGGVEERPGHTEAAVDIARLAGLRPAGLLCEICSSDGLHMADRAELLEIAAELGAPITTIAHLIRFRRRLDNVHECVRSSANG